MRKNTAGQVVAFQAVSTTDGSAVTTGTPVVYYTIDGGTQGTGGPTGGSGGCRCDQGASGAAWKHGAQGTAEGSAGGRASAIGGGAGGGDTFAGSTTR